MSDELPISDIVPETDEQRAAREAAEAEAKAEADRIAAEEAHKALVAEQTPRVFDALRYGHTAPQVGSVVNEILSACDPEAVTAGKVQFDAFLAKIEAERKEAERKAREFGSPMIASPRRASEKPSKPRRR